MIRYFLRSVGVEETPHKMFIEFTDERSLMVDFHRHTVKAYGSDIQDFLQWLADNFAGMKRFRFIQYARKAIVLADNDSITVLKDRYRPIRRTLEEDRKVFDESAYELMHTIAGTCFEPMILDLSLFSYAIASDCSTVQVMRLFAEARREYLMRVKSIQMQALEV